MDEQELNKILQIIRGEGEFSVVGKGITTYPKLGENNKKLHDLCLELERRGLIIRRFEQRGTINDFVFWMPKN